MRAQQQQQHQQRLGVIDEADQNDATTVRTATSTGSTASSAATASSVVNNFIAGALGRVANPLLVDVLDIDGVIRRIDFKEVFKQVDWGDAFSQLDWNEAFSQCDWEDAFNQADFNEILSKVDLNEVLARIDMDALLERIDINAVLERTDLGSIISKATSGICTIATDSIRAFCIKMDLRLARLGRCSDCFWWRSDYKKWLLPPLPTVTPIGRQKERRQDRKLRGTRSCPTKPSHLAIAVQGRNAGVCTRFIAFAIDKGLAIGFAFLFSLVFMTIYNKILENTELGPNNNPADQLLLAGVLGQTGSDQTSNLTITELKTLLDGVEEQQQQQNQRENLFFLVGLPIISGFVFGFVTDAFFLAVIGRTIGKLVMGLVVLNSHHGKVGKVTASQAICRAFLTNLGIISALGAFLSMLREDRRGIIDLLCSTTVVYAWDAKRFRLAEDGFAHDMPFGDLEEQQQLKAAAGSSEMEDMEHQPPKPRRSLLSTPYLRRVSTFGKPKNNKKKKHNMSKTETVMISVPSASVTGANNRNDRMGIVAGSGHGGQTSFDGDYDA